MNLQIKKIKNILLVEYDRRDVQLTVAEAPATIKTSGIDYEILIIDKLEKQCIASSPPKNPTAR
jgi:hypothetical protein